MEDKKVEYVTAEDSQERGKLPARILLQVNDGENYNILAEGELGYLADSVEENEDGVKSCLVSLASRARLLCVALGRDFEGLETKGELDYAWELLKYLATILRREPKLTREQMDQTKALLAEWDLDADVILADGWDDLGYCLRDQDGGFWYDWPEGFPVEELIEIRGGYR